MFPVWLWLLLLVPADDPFGQWFTGATLRFDYYHSGQADEARISLDGFRQDGPWPGTRNPDALKDDLNLGKYRIRVSDLESGELLFSRGFSSIFGEWETTGEAKRGNWRTFHESQRFPEPRRRSRIELQKREGAGFLTVFELEFDPQGRGVDRSRPGSLGKLRTLLESGDSAHKVDLLVMGDGYTRAEQEKFTRDAQRLTSVLLETEPFRSRRHDFNVRALHVDAVESGISDPRQGVWRNSPLGLSFNALDMDRYVLTYRNRELRELAAQAPYDVIMLLYNGRKYGGGGIYNLWGTCSADTEVAAYVFVHEFGHTFAGLADEYYSSQVSYESFTPPGVEPWEPNVTALLSPEKLKWGTLIQPDTPVPTPWRQSEYDRMSRDYESRRADLLGRGAPDGEMERLFEDQRRRIEELWAGEPFAGRVGAFEGASYEPKGIYRPSLDCIMFSRNPTEFCPVCRQALERVIDSYVR